MRKVWAPTSVGVTDKGASSLCASGTLYGATGPVKTIWQVPEEVPIAILFNSAPYAVMMATPADLDDFAAGFALAEGIITSASHVKAFSRCLRKKAWR